MYDCTALSPRLGDLPDPCGSLALLVSPSDRCKRMCYSVRTCVHRLTAFPRNLISHSHVYQYKCTLSTSNNAIGDKRVMFLCISFVTMVILILSYKTQPIRCRCYLPLATHSKAATLYFPRNVQNSTRRYRSATTNHLVRQVQCTCTVPLVFSGLASMQPVQAW